MTQEKCYSCGGKGTYSQMHGLHGAEDFGADGFDLPPGVHNYPCKACDGTGLKKVMTQDWKETLENLITDYADAAYLEMEENGSRILVEKSKEAVIGYVESLLKEEREKAYEEGRRNVLDIEIARTINEAIEQERNAVLSEVKREVENVIEQEAMWYNANNQIPTSELGKSDEHWEMLQKVVKDSLEEASRRMIKDISTIINNLRVK